MKHVKNLEVVSFDSIAELKEFVDNLGHAEFYDDFEGDYIPIRTDEDRVVLGSDAWEDVQERHLSNIYGFITL